MGYCLDANILITAWAHLYPPKMFKRFWDTWANYLGDTYIIKPIYDEIDPISQNDRKLSSDEKREKYGLRFWLIDNISPVELTQEVKELALNLELEYEIRENCSGVGQKDIALIAHAMLGGHTVVSLESQKSKPKEKFKYKIPAVCDDKGVVCMNFNEYLDKINFTI